jgi:hypothetical protein
MVTPTASQQTTCRVPPRAHNSNAADHLDDSAAGCRLPAAGCEVIIAFAIRHEGMAWRPGRLRARQGPTPAPRLGGISGLMVRVEREDVGHCVQAAELLTQEVAIAGETLSIRNGHTRFGTPSFQDDAGKSASGRAFRPVMCLRQCCGAAEKLSSDDPAGGGDYRVAGSQTLATRCWRKSWKLTDYFDPPLGRSFPMVCRR